MNLDWIRIRAERLERAIRQENDDGEPEGDFDDVEARRKHHHEYQCQSSTMTVLKTFHTF